VFSQVFHRRRLLLPFLFPCLFGIYYLWAYDAPARLIAINAGALVLGSLWVLVGRLPAAPRVRIAIAAVLALVLFVPLLTGPEQGGVARWLPAGPVSLHSGPLLLPLIVVLAGRNERFGPAVLALAGTSLALQPDAAALAALAAASGVLCWLHRSIAFGLVALGTAACAILTFGAGSLAPQVFTENVLPQVAARSMVQAVALAGILFAVPQWYLLQDPQTQRAEGWTIAALLTTLGVMALIAPFPYPLIGYGAAPILGFALALGATARREQLRVDGLLEVVERTTWS
jgi:hypothetical protein